jgi:hypothetical protein
LRCIITIIHRGAASEPARTLQETVYFTGFAKQFLSRSVVNGHSTAETDHGALPAAKGLNCFSCRAPPAGQPSSGAPP